MLLGARAAEQSQTKRVLNGIEFHNKKPISEIIFFHIPL